MSGGIRRVKGGQVYIYIYICNILLLLLTTAMLSLGPLHAMTPTRVNYICKSVQHERVWSFGSMRTSGSVYPDQETFAAKPLQGLTALDVGCGGGLLSEPLARQGAMVTGIDPCIENIEIARAHAQLDTQLREGPQTINYQTITAEELNCQLHEERNRGAEDNRFDIVVASEVIEHVNDRAVFVETLAHLVKPGGLVFISSINRTMKGYALAILGAEVITKVVPQGTHDWNNFPQPSELSAAMQHHGVQTRDVSGMIFTPNPFAHGGLSWALHQTDIDCNFIMYGSKNTCPS